VTAAAAQAAAAPQATAGMSNGGWADFGAAPAAAPAATPTAAAAGASSPAGVGGAVSSGPASTGGAGGGGPRSTGGGTPKGGKPPAKELAPVSGCCMFYKTEPTLSSMAADTLMQCMCCTVAWEYSEGIQREQARIVGACVLPSLLESMDLLSRRVLC
jgi:hypothetical protein